MDTAHRLQREGEAQRSGRSHATAWRELEQETRPIAWLSLNEGDNDAVVLWTYGNSRTTIYVGDSGSPIRAIPVGRIPLGVAVGAAR